MYKSLLFVTEHIVDKYAKALKTRYKEMSHKSENRWPPYTPKKFTKLGYIIYKSERTAIDTAKSAGLARSGSFVSESVEEEISTIFSHAKIKHPQIILIEGAPGIGKTMLAKEIRRLWATEEILKDKKILYYLSLSNPKINEMNSTKDMFFFSSKNEKQAEVCDTYFGDNGGQGLVILLDGLDENPQTMEPGSFLHTVLIEEEMFRKACIVITSRPHATVDLLKHASYRVEIIGFTDERRQEFVDENLKENAEDLKNYLKKHEIIDTLCYIPLNMTIVLFLFKENVKCKDLPKTQTELIKKAIRMTVFHNLQELEGQVGGNDLNALPPPYNEYFYNLSELAYNALLENKLFFTKNEIKKAYPASISDEKKGERGIINGLGLIQNAEYLIVEDGDTESMSNFAHYSIQELLAAWFVAFKHNSYFQQFSLISSIQRNLQKFLQIYSQFRVLTNYFWKEDLINMWSFYIGLTKGEDSSFKHYISGKAFYSYMQGKMFSWLMNNKDLDIKQCIISKEILENKIKMLLLYFLLQEAPGHKMIEYLDVVSTKTLDISGQPLNLKKDIYLLGRILSRPYLTKQWESVNLSCCEIDDEMFKFLHDELTKNDGRPKPDINNLLLSGNRLKSCSSIIYIANIVCSQKISHLNLSNNILNNLIPFEKCGEFLETLNASNNELGAEKVSESLFALRFLRKLKVLNLNHNKIKNDQGVNDAFGLALCSCNSLIQLKLDGNDTKFKNYAMLLFEVINEVRISTSDEHCYNKQSDKAFAFLKILGYCFQLDYQPDECTLRNKLTETKTLDISYCELETDAGCSLGRCLHLLVNLRTLDITHNKISDEATECLTKGMLLTPDLVQFKYDENLFNEKSIIIFEMIIKLCTTVDKSFECEPSKIKALLFILDCVDDAKMQQSRSKVVSIISNVTVLKISHGGSKSLDYKLTSEDFKELCGRLTWFKQLKVLDVKNNAIISTNEIRQSLTKAMLQTSTFNNVYLIGNPIYSDELSVSVFRTIKNVREEQIQVVVDNQKNSSHSLSRSVIYIVKCLNELTNPDCFKFDSINTIDIGSKSRYRRKFFEGIKFFPTLKHLRINNVKKITDMDIDQFDKYLCQNRTLITLDLSSCNLTKLEAKSPPNDRIPLKVLKLNYSNITHKVLLHLSLNMLMFADLDELDLEGNGFGDNGISNLHNALINCKRDQLGMTVTTLILAKNQLTSSSAIKIVEIVQKCKVKYLNISNNRLGNIFYKFKKITITTLEELNVSANPHPNILRFAKNLSYLKSCSSLKKLDISNNCIDETAIHEMYYTFVECSHLEEVICDENPAKYEIKVAFYFVKRLRNSIQKNTFKCPPSKIKAVVHLLGSIHDNKQKLQSSDLVHKTNLLKELNIGHNKPTSKSRLTSQDCKELCGVLIWLKHLEILDVRNNDITNETRESLTKLMLQISSLNTVKLIGNPIADDEFSMSVFHTIKNLREEQIQSIDHNQKSPFDLLCHSVIYIMQCLNELENPNCFKSFDNITTFDINLKLSYVGKFFEYIKLLPSLKHLRINYAKNITDIGINQLGEYLCQNRTLITLDLSLCNLKRLNVKSPPSDRIPLKVVKFNHSNITHKVLLHLSLNILMFADLDELDLGGNLFRDNGISNLHNALMSCKNDQLGMTITTLILATNRLTSCAAKVIEIVEICRVKHLNISNNCLENIFCQLKDFTITSLEELNVSANVHSNVVQFANNLSNLNICSSLKKLDISNNSIDETVILEIYHTFVKCCHLEEVICDENPAKYEIEVAFYFVKSLHNSPHKNTFKCPPSKIKAVVCLLKSIQDNEKKLQSSDLVYRMSFVTELNLSHSETTTLEYKLTSQDFKELCGALTWLKHLKKLDVRNNDIRSSDEIRESLTKLMLQTSALNTVKLIGNPITDDEFSMGVFDTIKYLREEQIQSIVDNKDSSNKLSHYIIYVMECLNELENPDCFKSLDNIITVDIDSESNYAGNFFEYIKFLPFLKSLKINNVKNITDTGINQLSEYLCQNRTLTTLDLSSCNLEKLDIKSAPIASGRIPLKVLKLNDSNISQELLLNLSLNVLMFAYLDELDLGGNLFGDNGISNLHSVLISCKSDQLGMTVTTLILAKNQLISCAAKVVEIVEKCKVKHLNISYNDLRSDFCCHFENLKIETLEELIISAINDSPDNSVQFSENISYLKSCGSLKKLDIGDNCIDETAIDVIHFSFLKCTHFKEVVCTKNPAENDIKKAFELVQNLQYQPSCVKMIDFQELPKAAFTLITDSLEILQVGQVTSFDFSNNDMKIDESFFCFLKNCTEVQFLNLENNNITDETHKYLAKGFIFTSNLKLSNLHLKGNPCEGDQKCTSVLEMIETLRSNISEFECAPKKFEIFLTILELVHSVDGKPNDIAKTISLIKFLNISYKDLTSRQIDYTNQLQSRDIESFCNYLNYFKSLESINMSGNNIQEDVKDNLVITVLKNYNIIEIHLEGNPIHKISQCRILFETIGKLRRCGNKCSFRDLPQTLEALVSILQYVNKFNDQICDITNNIEQLDISLFYKQPHIKRRYGFQTTNNPKEISAGLIHHLMLFRNLKSLNLHNAYLTPGSLAELSIFLSSNNTLQYLDISNNDIQAEGALIILKSLSTNTTLKKLNLSNNNITGGKHQEVITIIGRLPIEVDMSGNKPTKVSKRFFKL